MSSHPGASALSALQQCREFCGTDGPDLARAVEGLPLDAVDRLAEGIVGEAARVAGQAEQTRPGQADRPENELWPLVNARASMLSRGAGAGGMATAVQGAGPSGVNIMAAMSPRDIGGNTFSAGVMRALLYSHGLVLEDPLAMAAELHHLAPRETRPYSQLFVHAALTSLLEIAELLDAGVVETYFVPTDVRRQTRLAEVMRAGLDEGPLSVDDVWDAFEANYIEGLKPSLRELWRRIRSGDRNPDRGITEQAAREDADMLRIFVDVVSSIRPAAVIDNTVAIVASALEDVGMLRGRADVLCNSRLHAQLLYLGTDDPVVRQRVEELAAVQVPRLDGLAVSDVVKIRRLSDAFEQWRTDLSLGLDRAHTMRAELGDGVEVAPLVAETLRVARRGLTDEAKHLRPQGSGLVAFAAGALGGAVGGLLDGAMGAAVGGAGSIAASVVAHAGDAAVGAWGSGAGSKDARGVLRRHYVVFDRVGVADESAQAGRSWS
ncbi:hypothetical protein [Pedococcus soli]